jgi:AraC-like DNA-binding protein
VLNVQGDGAGIPRERLPHVFDPFTRFSSGIESSARGESIGLTLVHGYVMRKRVEMAQELMLSTSEPLSSIALICGLSDQSHLTRWFRRVLGQTPAFWRRMRRRAPFGHDTDQRMRPEDIDLNNCAA